MISQIAQGKAGAHAPPPPRLRLHHQCCYVVQQKAVAAAAAAVVVVVVVVVVREMEGTLMRACLMAMLVIGERYIDPG